MSKHASNLDVLLVDDNPDDVFMLTRAFAESPVPATVETAQDGAMALEYLKSCVHGDATPPSVVLLDLNMPGINGFEVLKRIQAEPALRALRVIVLSTSDRKKDIEDGYEAGACSYLVKPASYQETRGMCCAIVQYWLQYNKNAEQAL